MAIKPISAEERAKEIFLYAESFAASAEALAKRSEATAKENNLESKPIELSEFAPIAVMDSFAAELYLKALHWIDSGKGPKRIHKFRDLFDTLSLATQKSIKTWYVEKRDGQFAPMRDQISREYPKFDHSFENCLNLSNDTFTKIRYGFEGIDQPIFYWPTFRVAIGNTIKSTAPGWNWTKKS